MTLAEFRKEFVQLSGRFDLVKDTQDYKDDGADFLINAGVRLLDSMFTHTKSYATSEIQTEIGKSVYDVPSMLSIEGVQRGSDKGRVTLTHIEEHVLQEIGPTEKSSSGVPASYAIFTSVSDGVTGNSKDNLSKLTIKVTPTPDKVLSLYVYGRVSLKLSNENSQNFWTINYPEILISATMYQIERFHRNRQGMADHMAAIQRDMRNLDADAIESQMGSITQMRDSFKFRGDGNEW